MTDLFITASANSPFVLFRKTGEMEMSESLFWTKMRNFGRNFFSWIDDYKNVLPSKTTFNLQVDYLNTSSLKELNKFLILITSLNSEDSELNIFWHYNESDIYMKEIGFELSKQSGFNFQMKIVKEFV